TVAVRSAPVARLVAVTFAPRTPNPCGSVTRPVKVAVFTCATAVVTPSKIATHRITHANNGLRCIPFLLLKLARTPATPSGDGLGPPVDGPRHNEMNRRGCTANRESLQLESAEAPGAKRFGQ